MKQDEAKNSLLKCHLEDIKNFNPGTQELIRCIMDIPKQENRQVIDTSIKTEPKTEIVIPNKGNRKIK